MRRTRNGFAGKQLALLVACLGCVAFAAPALAQGSPSGGGDEERGLLEEIIVTARKREERFLDVPISVETITAAALEAGNVGVFQDMVEISPSLTYTPSGGMRGDGVLIRGIGTTAFQSGVEPTVSTVVDGVVLGRTGAFLSDLVDIERVEILRGPQGTLFGKNASGGVINVITGRPADSFESFVEVTVAEHAERQVQGMVSGPMGPALAGRLTAFVKERDGYIRNAFDGRKLNGSESWGLRGKLHWQPNDDVDVLLIADTSELDRNCCIWTVREIGTVGDNFNPSLANDLASIAVGPENDQTNVGSPVFSNMEISGVSIEANWTLDSVQLTSIAAYRQWEISTAQDVDNIAPVAPDFAHILFNLNGGVSETDQWSVEIRAANAEPGTVEYTLGVYVWGQDLHRFFERGIEAPRIFLGTNAAGFLLDGDNYSEQYAYFNTNVDTLNMSAFGHATWNLAENWSLLGGFRYTYDDLEYDFDRVCPTALSVFHPCALLPAVAAFKTQGGDSDSDFSGKLGVQYDFSESGMLYASWTQGYKAQAFGIVFGYTAADAANQPLRPETSDAFEIGTKLELAGGRALLSAAAFHMEFQDYHAQSFDSGTNSFVLQNAGAVVSEGFELDLLTRPLENLTLSAGLAYTDATFDEFPTGPCYQGQTGPQGCMGRDDMARRIDANGNIRVMREVATPDGTILDPQPTPVPPLLPQVQNLAGGKIANSPDWRFSVQARYDILCPSLADFYVQGNLRWQDETLSHINQNPDLRVADYSVLDLAVGFTGKNGNWSGAFYIENVFDEFYPGLLIETPLNGNGVSQFLNRDYRRFFGARLRYTF